MDIWFLALSTYYAKGRTEFSINIFSHNVVFPVLKRKEISTFFLYSRPVLASVFSIKCRKGSVRRAHAGDYWKPEEHLPGMHARRSAGNRKNSSPACARKLSFQFPVSACAPVTWSSRFRHACAREDQLASMRVPETGSSTS